MTSSRSYYDLLGVSRSADALALRTAFRQMSKALHPDTTTLPADEAAKCFQLVCEAYQLLADSQLREAYDISLDEAEQDQLNSVDDRAPLVNTLAQKEIKSIEVRRPLSGGELFSLLSLCIALLMSLILGVGFAIGRGRELQVRPGWLMLDETFGYATTYSFRDVVVASSSDPFKSPFSSFVGELASSIRS